MKTFILILLSLTCAFGQVKMAEHEFTGTVTAISSGYGFYLSIIDLKTENDLWRFWIAPKYGKSVLSKIKLGESISLRVLVYPNNLADKNWRESMLKYSFASHGMAHEVKLGNEWIPTPFSYGEKPQITPSKQYVFLEQKIRDDYHLDGLRKGLIFENGRIAFANYATRERFSMEKIIPRDIVSFVGVRSPVMDGYIYPIDGVKDVYSFNPLDKVEGAITSFIYKEDFLRVGLVVKQRRLHFPPDLAKDIEPFANGEKVTIYFDQSKDGRLNNLPSIYAMVSGSDTLLMSYNYGHHEHTPVELSGKITRISQSAQGRISYITVGSEYIVDVIPSIEEQLKTLLTKGRQIKITGDERVKKSGEVYEKNYRIVRPRKIEVEGKEFIINAVNLR